MLRFEPPVELQLAPGRLLRWQQHEAVRLRVAAGRVWITRCGDPDDHFLDAGQHMLLAPRAQVLVGAERAGARILIETAPASQGNAGPSQVSLTPAGGGGPGLARPWGCSEEGAQVVDRRVVGEAAQPHVARPPGLLQQVRQLGAAAVGLHRRLGGILAQAAR